MDVSSPVSIDNKKITNKYLPLLLFFILVDETCNNYIFNLFSYETWLYQFALYVSFLIFQIIAAPIQAGYSDFYCRRKSLIFSLLVSAFSLGLACFVDKHMALSMLLLPSVILLKGLFGNTLPLSWAAIADTQTRNFRFSLGLSTSAIALGYLVLILIERFFHDAIVGVIVISLYVFLIALCIKFFKDVRDRDSGENKPASGGFSSNIKNEMLLIFNNYLKSNRIRKALLAFLFWEFSFYTAHILDVDLKLKAFHNLTITMVFGYLSGVILLKFLKLSSKKLIRVGYLISVVGPLPMFILSPVIGHENIFIIPCYFFYSLRFAFLVPSLFSMLSAERRSHEQEKI